MTEANITVDLNRPYLPPLGQSQQIIGRVTVEPGIQTSNVERHIALVVDTSGSMSGAKMERAKNGAKYVLGYLDDDDIISIIGFNSSPTTLLPASRYGEIGREYVVEKIDELTAGGGTDIHGGLNEAAEELKDIPRTDNTARRILLLSDGKDNKRGPADFERQAQEIDGHGIRIRAGGVGDEYSEETIRTLGTAARGEWSHIEEAAEIQEFFGEAVAEAATVVGSNTELEMNIADGVEFTEVYRAMPQVQQTDVEYMGPNIAVVKLPDLRERETQQVLMKIQVPGFETEQSFEIADLTLRAGSQTATTSIEVTFTDDGDLLGVENQDVGRALDMTRVKDDLGKGNVEDAETRVEQLETKYGEQQEIEELEDDVTRVKQGGRAEQENATRVKPDDGKI